MTENAEWRRVRAALLVMLALVALAGAAAGAAPIVGLTPDPVPGGQPFTVRLALGEPVESGVLRLCYAEGGNVTMCRLPQEMRVDADGALVVEPDPVPPAQQFGLNFTVRLVDGTVLHHPSGDAQYEFHTAGAGGRTTPPLSAAVALAGVVLAGVLTRRRPT